MSIPASLPVLPPDWTLMALHGRDRAGRQSQPHRHRQGQLVGSLRGLLSVGTTDALWVVPPGSAIWWPPDCLHHVRSHGAFDGWTLYVAPDRCADLPDTPRLIPVSGLLREAVLRAARRDSVPAGALEALDVLILAELSAAPAEAVRLPMPVEPRASRVARAILADPADTRDISAWAALACTSERTLGRLFRRDTGLALADWRRRARLLRGIERLAEGEAIGNVGLDVGFATSSAFIAAFRRTFGTTPGCYRDRLA